MRRISCARNKFLRAVLVVAACMLLTGHQAHAAGNQNGDLGTVSIGRGTAFVAKADNLSSFFYNPAGLSKSKGPNLLLVVNIANVNLDFTRSGSGDPVLLQDGNPTYSSPCTQENFDNTECVNDPNLDYSNDIAGEPFKKVSLGKKFGPSPMLVFSWGDAFNVEGLALAIGVFTPPGFGTPSYSKTGAQRYTIRDANLMMIYPGVGISYAFNRYFQIGAVFASALGTMEQDLAIRPEPKTDHFFHNENADGDANIKFLMKDTFVPYGIIGVMSNPVDWLEIGASVRLPTKIAPEGKIKYTAPETDMPNSVLAPGKDKIKMAQHYPVMLRAGARYIHRLFDIEFDFVWENWANYKATYDLDSLLLDEPREIDFKAKGEFVRDFRDSYSFRLGGDIQVWPEHLAIRLGGFYTTSAYPENYDTFVIDNPYGEQVGIGGGLTWHVFEYLDFNLGYMHIFQMDVNVKEGVQQQMGSALEMPDGSKRDLGNIINNGSYEVSMNTLGLSLEGHF